MSPNYELNNYFLSKVFQVFNFENSHKAAEF